MQVRIAYFFLLYAGPGAKRDALACALGPLLFTRSTPLFASALPVLLRRLPLLPEPLALPVGARVSQMAKLCGTSAQQAS
jgi:hypothetical protein